MIHDSMECLDMLWSISEENVSQNFKGFIVTVIGVFEISLTLAQDSGIISIHSYLRYVKCSIAKWSK